MATRVGTMPASTGSGVASGANISSRGSCGTNAIGDSPWGRSAGIGDSVRGGGGTSSSSMSISDASSSGARKKLPVSSYRAQSTNPWSDWSVRFISGFAGRT